MINKAMVIGKVNADPTIRASSDGSRVANFVIITARHWTDKKTGLPRTEKQKHNVAIFAEKVISVVENRVKAGTLVFVEGPMEARRHKDAAGNEIESVDIMIRPMSGSLDILKDVS